MGSKENYLSTKEYYKRLGRCFRCAKNKVVEGKSYCQSCIDYKKEYNKKYAIVNKEIMSAKNRARYQYYKDNNICPQCKTKKKTKSKYTYCLFCRKKAIENKEQRMLKKKGFV